MKKRISSDKWFVTISAYNSGSGLTDHQIQTILKTFHIGLDCEAVKRPLEYHAVVELRNSKGEDFKHLHFFIKNKKIQSQDNVRKYFLKGLKEINLYNNQKDLNVKACVNESILIGGYLNKTQDYLEVATTLSQEIKNQYIQIGKDYTKKVCVLQGKKVPSYYEAPYSILLYINDNHLEYNTSYQSFREIIKLMIHNDYVMHHLFGKFTKIKATVDLLYADTNETFDILFSNEFCKDLAENTTVVHCDCQLKPLQ